MFKRILRWMGENLWPDPPRRVHIETRRLVLRELEEQDTAAMLAYSNDPEIERFVRRQPRTVASVWMTIHNARLQMWNEDRTHFMLGMQDAQSGRLIGDCILAPVYDSEASLKPESAAIGFQVAQDLWGRGYATEAAVALLRFAFEELGMQSVVGGCHPDNIASRRVMEKSGMVFQGTQENFPGSPDGIESLVFVLGRDQWIAQTGRGAEDSPDASVENGYDKPSP